jgi:hypothetical protein
MEYKDPFGAGGGRLTKDAHDRAMRHNKGPLFGGHNEPPKRRPMGTRKMLQTR